jgi:cobalamin biosynthesis protein CobT
MATQNGDHPWESPKQTKKQKKHSGDQASGKRHAAPKEIKNGSSKQKISKLGERGPPPPSELSPDGVYSDSESSDTPPAKANHQQGTNLVTGPLRDIHGQEESPNRQKSLDTSLPASDERLSGMDLGHTFSGDPSDLENDSAKSDTESSVDDTQEDETMDQDTKEDASAPWGGGWSPEDLEKIRNSPREIT